MCAEVRDYVVEHLDDGAGILAVDETSFLKRGEESVGVGRQYCGLTGQIENCQVGVFLAYISSKGQSLIDRRLYLLLLRSGLALWLRSRRSVRSRPAQSCRTEAMGLEVTISPLLVFSLNLALVFLAQTYILLWLATIITANVPKLPRNYLQL